MPALGTCLAGTTPFAGEHLVEASASAEGRASALLVPAVLVAPGARFEGRGAGGPSGVVVAVSRLLAFGAAGGAVPGLTPRAFRLTSSAGSDDAALAAGLLRGAVDGRATATAEVAGYPMYLGEGVRVDFRDVDAFPQITFDEVFR